MTQSSQSSGIRDLLYRVKISPEENALKIIKSELDTLFSNLAQPGVNEDFRSDLLKIVTASIDLAQTMASASYNIDEVLSDLSSISRRLGFILTHVSEARPRTIGYGLVHRDNGRVLPNIWLEEGEARKYVTSMQEMGVLPPSVSIIPVELASRYIPRPRTPPPPQAITSVDDNVKMPDFMQSSAPIPEVVQFDAIIPSTTSAEPVQTSIPVPKT